MKQRSKKRLGEVLQEEGKQSGQRLAELVPERGLVSKLDLAEALHTNVPYLDCTKVEPQPDALQKIPQTVPEQFCVLPVEQKKRLIAVKCSSRAGTPPLCTVSNWHSASTTSPSYHKTPLN